MCARALFHVGPQRVACREVTLRPPAAGEVEIAGLYSAISPGTEGMIFAGAFPADAPLDASLGTLAGNFTYPFRYGYSLVGEVSATGPGVDERLLGTLMFVFHPHQDRVVVPLAACHRVPANVPPEAALFLPQVETALNLVLDGAPLIGERVLVFGLGVVGLLTAGLLSEFPLARLVAAEPLSWRREHAKAWGIAETVDPSDAERWRASLGSLDGADLAFELSGEMSALDLAIQAVGFDGRIVAGSWYGTRSLPLSLGDRFHRNRLRLISSQVSTIAPALSGRWDQNRRIGQAWRLLERLRPQRIPHRSFPLEQCQEAFEAVCAREKDFMQAVFSY